jgi:putative membrane protein
VFLTVAALVVLVSESGWRGAAVLIALGALGFSAEVVGVRTGVPFGAYSYTDALGPKALDVPVVMVFAWLVIVAGVAEALALGSRRAIVEAPAAAACATAIDFVLDPVAANPLDYWRWVEAGTYYGIPASNFVGWFVVSLAIFAVARRRRRSNGAAWLVGVTIILFFALVGWAFGLVAPAVVGFTLFVLALATRRCAVGAGFARWQDGGQRTADSRPKM